MNPFYFHDGRAAYNIEDLKVILEDISMSDFSEFVNEKKNDFATWVQFSLQNPDLASRLRQTTDYDEILSILGDELGEGQVSEETREEEPQEPEETGGGEEWTNHEDESKSPEDRKEIEKEVESLMTETAQLSEKMQSEKPAPVSEEKKRHLDRSKYYAHKEHNLRYLLLGTAFGFIVGLIVMYVLIYNGVI